MASGNQISEMSSKNTGPYDGNEHMGSSVLETTTILSNILRPEGYSRDIINDIAVNTFLENERNNIKDKSSMHLLALKKSLLYAIPVITPRVSNTGIQLTSQVVSPAIQYNPKNNKANKVSLAIGDKFRLIGFSFPNKLINHLNHDIFPWKYFAKLPVGYQPSPIDLSHIKPIETKNTSSGIIYLIKPSHYEDISLFNEINRIIAFKLLLDFTSILSSTTNLMKEEKFPELSRIESYNNLKFIDKLNMVLPRQIDKTYTMSLYEALQMTANLILYDQIELLGFDSPEVNKYLAKLKYIKEQNLKVQTNLRVVRQQLLLNTRAEKITRERYPHFFDYTDRRAIFIKFNRFSIDKLPKNERNEIQILLEKDLAAQKALLNNHCEHLNYLKDLKESSDYETILNAYKKFEPFVNYDSVDDSQMYSCKLCSYPILCAHEIDLYEALSTINNVNGSDGSDQAYWVQQKIINRYKLVDQRRTGDEDTESSFTYYCKHCGGELGKSDDIIQATLKTQNESSMVIQSDSIETTIYNTISTVIGTNMNQSIVPMSRKSIAKLIFDESKDEINNYVKRATKVEQDNIDLMIKYISSIYALSGLISININKLKSSENILILSKSSKQNEISTAEPVEGGAQLKDELIIALKIIQSNATFKRIGITDDKIKTMLIEAFKFMNRIIANEAIQFKSTTPRDKLEFDIKNGPIASYATFMYNLAHKKNARDNLSDIVGVDMDSLFPKSKKITKPSTHALYTNIYKPKGRPGSDVEKYIYESYQSIVDFVIQEPIIGKYTSIITEPVSKFVKDYERKQSQQIKLRKTVPVRYLPVENGREYDFELKVYQIAYCFNDGEYVRPHRWVITKKDSKLIYTCKYCNINIEKASKALNDKIEDKLDEQMLIEAFFELYTLSCPIKDAHVFESEECIQCKVTKNQLSSMDSKYYKKYESTYLKHREGITGELINAAISIGTYAKTIDKGKIVELNKDDTQVKSDMIKLESLASSLSKLYGHNDLKTIGADSTNNRSLEIIESYVRLLYSHYIFVKNLSIDTHGHPDSEFFSLIKEKFFTGVKPKQIKMPALPDYPISSNADQLLTELFQIIYDLASKGIPEVNELLRFILNKIVQQDARHKQYNFAKLKSVAIKEEDDETEIIVVDEEEEEFDMFDGYDIDAEDMEDNIDGDYD